MEATINVYTYRAGLLARLAHDLRFTFWRHEVTVQGRRVRGSCATDSFRVDGTMTARGLDRRGLSFNDRHMITTAVRDEVLQIDKYPRVEFDGEVAGDAPGRLRVQGTLQIRGQSRTVESALTVQGDRLRTAFELTLTEFGIAPFKALAGAITLRDRVRITVDVLLDGEKLTHILDSSNAVLLAVADD
jgi:YceI-like domain